MGVGHVTDRYTCSISDPTGLQRLAAEFGTMVSKNTDVRMRGFAERVPISQALEWIDARCSRVDAEQIATVDAVGRVLAQEIASDVNVPAYRRSMMDGYALLADDTSGAGSYNRLTLRVVGESLPADPWRETLGSGQAVRIMTGAPVPEGADAVLPVECTEVRENLISISDTVTPGKHVGHPGEDIATGDVVLKSGRRLRPQDLGVLVSIGCGRVSVRRHVRVRIVVTGNELLPPGAKPTKNKIVDSNSPMLSALIQRDGGVVTDSRILPDDPTEILAAMRNDVDLVLVSGGSSVGKEDHAPVLLSRHGDLAIHGISMRPSSPTGMGTLDGRMVFLLPGNPVSCLCAYDFFAGRAIRGMAGLPALWPYARRRLPLARKLVSVVGRLDYARVDIVDDQVTPLAISGASMLSSTTRAAGFVVIDADSEGYPPGAEVDVWLYD